MKTFGRDESRTSTQETKKIQIKLATICKKNEQHNVKNNAELSTKWTKTTLKTCEENFRQDRNRSIKPNSTDDDDDDDDDDDVDDVFI